MQQYLPGGYASAFGTLLCAERAVPGRLCPQPFLVLVLVLMTAHHFRCSYGTGSNAVQVLPLVQAWVLLPVRVLKVRVCVQ